MISSRSGVRWVLFGLLAAAGIACLGGERDDPEWELVIGMSSSGVSSSGTTSSGTGGSTSSGTGGSTSSGTGGSTSSGTGGAGGAPVVCDGTGVCQTCVDCALTNDCAAQWDACQADAVCLAHIQCEQLALLACANDADPAGCFFLESDLCTVMNPGSGFDALRLCFCSTSCAQDCAADLSFHCVDQLPAL